MKISMQDEPPQSEFFLLSLGTAFDTLIGHFNSQIDSLQQRVLDMRRDDLSIIDGNFAQLRVMFAGLTTKVEEVTLTSRTSKKAAQLDIFKQDSHKMTSKRAVQHFEKLKSIDPSIQESLVEETRQMMEQKTHAVRKELDTVLSKVSQQIIKQQQ